MMIHQICAHGPLRGHGGLQTNQLRVPDGLAKCLLLRRAQLNQWAHYIVVVHISVGEVRSRTDWDLVWTGPNPAVPVPVWDFPKIPGLLGLRSGHSHIARDHLRPGLDQDRMTYISNMLILYF